MLRADERGKTHVYPSFAEGPCDELREADIEINGVDYQWSMDGEVPGTRSLRAILAHELGHLFGLADLVRATTTGVTTVIAPTGQNVWMLPEGVASTGVASVRWIRTRTLYETLGDWPFGVAPLGLLLAARLARRGRGGLIRVKGRSAPAPTAGNPEDEPDDGDPQ